MTLDTRSALNDNDTASEKLASSYLRDPAFAALLVAIVPSPLYLQSTPATILAAFIALLGMPKVASLAKGRSVKSLFIVRSAKVTKLHQ